jgi:hypothetical protein
MRAEGPGLKPFDLIGPIPQAKEDAEKVDLAHRT